MPKQKTHSGSKKRFKVTGSGKIMRGTMRRIADNQDYNMPATIDDPAILAEIETALRRAGLAAR